MITALYNDFLIFSFSIGLCFDNNVDNDNGICVTDAVFEPEPIEISGNFYHPHTVKTFQMLLNLKPLYNVNPTNPVVTRHVQKFLPPIHLR
jgi:hypothetical protein